MITYDCYGKCCEKGEGIFILRSNHEQAVKALVEVAESRRAEIIKQDAQIAALRLEISDLVIEHEDRCGAASKCIAELKAEIDEVHNRWQLAVNELLAKISTLRAELKAATQKYPNGARGCCCLFDDAENPISWCKPHADLRDEIMVLKAENEEMYNEVKIQMLDNKELRADNQRQAEEIAELKSRPMFGNDEVARLTEEIGRLREALKEIKIWAEGSTCEICGEKKMIDTDCYDYVISALKIKTEV